MPSKGLCILQKTCLRGKRPVVQFENKEMTEGKKDANWQQFKSIRTKNLLLEFYCANLCANLLTQVLISSTVDNSIEVFGASFVC